MSILLAILTIILIFVSLFLGLIVLAQKAKNDGGMGAALGGGMAESAFGADTSNVLSKATIYSAITFFVLAFAIYLGRIYERAHAKPAGEALPTIAAPASVKPAPAPTTAAPIMVPKPANAAPAPATPAPEKPAPKKP